MDDAAWGGRRYLRTVSSWLCRGRLEGGLIVLRSKKSVGLPTDRTLADDEGFVRDLRPLLVHELPLKGPDA